MKLNNLLKNIFNKKNYKFIMLLLLTIIIIFLFCGNYNLSFDLKEGYDKTATLNETLSNNASTLIEANNIGNSINNSTQNAVKESNINLHDNNLTEPMTNSSPNICSTTDYNVSNIGTPNNGASNTLTNIQNVQNNLKSQNQLCTNSTSVIV
tara:strand:- start:52 stop:507 length:456 start_codon:yes stop_codon:yes gene_type:complete